LLEYTLRRRRSRSNQLGVLIAEGVSTPTRSSRVSKHGAGILRVCSRIRERGKSIAYPLPVVHMMAHDLA